MSHVAKIAIDVKDLAALEKACAEMGLKLERNITTFNSYQRGLKCDHRIVDPANPHAYQVGVVAAEGGKFDLLFDEYAGGQGMVAKIGQGAARLKQHYSAEVATSYYRRKGFRVSRTVKEDGRVVLTAAK